MWGLGATAALIAAGYWLGRADPGRIPRPALAFRAVAGAAVVSGLSLRLWATWLFWSVGGGTPLPPFEPSRLVTSGPYRHSRNPLYLGWLSIFLGLGLLLGSRRLLISTFGLWVMLERWWIPWEEARLEQTFGASYLRYRDRTPRWFGFRHSPEATER